jgi:CBS domain-containing protein
MSDVKVKDAMTTKVITISPGDSILEAAALMRKQGGGALIVKSHGKLVGILTHGDLVNRVLALDKKPSEVLVSEVMTKRLISTTPETDLTGAMKILLKNNIKRLPVVENEKLVGILSYKDVLRVSPGLIEFLSERVREEPPISVAEEEKEEEALEGECELCGNFYQNLHKRNDRWVCKECEEEAVEI